MILSFELILYLIIGSLSLISIMLLTLVLIFKRKIKLFKIEVKWYNEEVERLSKVVPQNKKRERYIDRLSKSLEAAAMYVR